MFFAGVGHRFLLFEEILLPRTEQETVVGGTPAGDEYLPSGQGAGRGVVLDLVVVDGCKAVNLSQRAEHQQFLALPEEADLGSHLMADLDEALLACKRHH